jgi:hypothetical protein
MSEIKYVLLVVSHPTWEPTSQQLGEFLYGQLPELKENHDDTQIGLLVETCQLTPEFMLETAIDTFGSDVNNDEKYTYRTIHGVIDGGEARILVAYDKSSGEGCFIATACCGSYDSPEVLILRRYRDEVLLNSQLGTCFINWYYKISPKVALFIGSRKMLKSFLRIIFVKPIARVLSCLIDMK